MGNPQETDPLKSRMFKLGWLVGAIEGEGTIGIHRSYWYKDSRGYKPCIKIGNTNQDFINRIAEFADEFELPYYVRPTYRKTSNPKHKPCYHMTVEGVKRCSRWFETVKPEYFSNKRKQAESVKEFCESRLSHPMTFQNQSKGYTERELELYAVMRELNRRGTGKGSSTTTRES